MPDEKPAEADDERANIDCEFAGIAVWERGGADDPVKTFADLNYQLRLCKEEFSPWGWRVWIAEFAEKFEAEKRLRALNALPESGAEKKDGVVKGTPVWQDRLDKMCLVEHLKLKLMTAHSRMVEGIELLLKAFAWLVKNPLLADAFSHCIRHIPASQFDRVDLLQKKLEEKRRQLKEAREHHEDYLITQFRQRDAYLKVTTENQRHSNDWWILDDVVLSWKEHTQKMRILRESHAKASLQARCAQLETQYLGLQEDVQDKERQFKEALEWMTADRDSYKKKYKRMVDAHERAKRDLEATKGTAEGMKQMIMVLSAEKTALEQKVEDLEEEKRRLLIIIEELRELVALLRKEIKRLVGFTRGTELALLAERNEARHLQEKCLGLENALDQAAGSELRMRDDNDCLKTELGASLERYGRALRDLSDERALRGTVERERDRCIAKTRSMQDELTATLKQCLNQVFAIKEKARRDLQHFKEVELARVKADFAARVEVIMRRNAILEKEVAIGDDCAPQLSVLAPVEMDSSKLCGICRRIIIYEGAMPI